MKFKIDDKVYEFDESRLLVREARELKHYTGMGLKQFGEGLQGGDADAIVGMLYLARRRAGEAVQWSDFDEYNIADLEMIEDEEEKDEAPAVVDGTVATTNGVAPHPPALAAAEGVPTPA